MPDIQDALDVTFNELTTEEQLQLKEAIDQFQHKCLLSFSKNRSGVPFLKSEKQEVMGMVQQTMEDIMARHNTAFLNIFRQMMISVFGPGTEKVLNQMSPQGPNGEIGESSAPVNGQPTQEASAQPLSYGPPWARYLGGYQDRLLGGPLGLPDLRYTAPDGMKHKDCRGEVLG
jgi:hypothetical protein